MVLEAQQCRIFFDVQPNTKAYHHVRCLEHQHIFSEGIRLHVLFFFSLTFLLCSSCRPNSLPMQSVRILKLICMEKIIAS